MIASEGLLESLHDRGRIRRVGQFDHDLPPGRRLGRHELRGDVRELRNAARAQSATWTEWPLLANRRAREFLIDGSSSTTRMLEPISPPDL